MGVGGRYGTRVSWVCASTVRHSATGTGGWKCVNRQHTQVVAYDVAKTAAQHSPHRVIASTCCHMPACEFHTSVGAHDNEHVQQCSHRPASLEPRGSAAGGCATGSSSSTPGATLREEHAECAAPPATAAHGPIPTPAAPWTPKATGLLFTPPPSLPPPPRLPCPSSARPSSHTLPGRGRAAAQGGTVTRAAEGRVPARLVVVQDAGWTCMRWRQFHCCCCS